MITKTVRGGYDAWVQADKPKKRRPRSPALWVQAGERDIYLYAKNPVPRRAICVSAKVRLRARGDSSGARTMIARRVSKKWRPRTLTWDNKPGVFGASQPTASFGALSNGDPVEFDVTQHMSGKRYLGWRFTSDAANAHAFHSFNSSRFKPVLVVEYTWRPEAPTNLTSSNGAVSLAKPVLRFDFNDLSGRIALDALQVQIDPNANATTPAWDSGEIATDYPELDLATTTYPGLADNATTKWRARVKSEDGYWSDWSAWVSFSRAVKGVLTIIAPGAAPADVVTEPTPPFLWTFTDQKKYQVRITLAENRRKILHDSGPVRSADNAWTPPPGVLTRPGTRYSVIVRGWDSKPRIATSGDPVFVEAVRDFTFAFDPTPDPVDWVTVEQVAREPRARLRFHRADGPPDLWAIERNGVVVAADIDPEDLLLVEPNTWEYDDWTAPAYTDLVYRPVPIVNGVGVAGGPTAAVKLRIGGVWVADPATGWRFNLLEVGQAFGYGEDDEITPKATGSARKITSMRGLEDDSVTGVLVESFEDPRPLAEQLADVFAIKERPTRTYRVSLVDVNFPARVGRVSPAPASEFLEGIEQRAMGFGAWQDGELPFEAQA